MSLQLEIKAVEYRGARYELRCNMKVLDRLQDAHGGSMKAVFDSPIHDVSAELFLLMLNQERARRGEEPVTRDELAEDYNYAMIEDLDVFGMFLRAMDAKTARRKDAEDGEKN